MNPKIKIFPAVLFFLALTPLLTFAAPLEGLDAASGGSAAMGFEASREFSGKPFLEMQNKAQAVKLDFTVQPAKAVPLKLSAPVKRKTLGSTVKSLPDDIAALQQREEDMQKEGYKLIGLAMDLSIVGVGVVYGGLAFGIPGAIVGGAVAYGVWYLARQ